jgi:hypothetical protein
MARRRASARRPSAIFGTSVACSRIARRASSCRPICSSSPSCAMSWGSISIHRQAVVFCMAEKSGIQALDRTQRALPLRPGLPERQTHDDRRHGTTCLFAALRPFDGLVLATVAPSGDTAGFVRFLDQFDQVTAADHAWLAAHPRVTFHFFRPAVPGSNLVERRFGEITRQSIGAAPSDVSAHQKPPTSRCWSTSRGVPRSGCPTTPCVLRGVSS